MEESMLSLPPVLAGEGLPLFFAFSMQCTRAWYGMSDPIMFPRTTLFMSTMSMSMSAMPMVMWFRGEEKVELKKKTWSLVQQ